MVCALLGHNAYLWAGKRIVPGTDILALLPVQEQDPILQRSFTQMVDAAQQRVIVLVGAPQWDDAKRPPVPTAPCWPNTRTCSRRPSCRIRPRPTGWRRSRRTAWRC
ncbi:hypothetical protein LP419_36620 [Massilia sp. H-1]|nr:hypothetical protein LP419_36620 [Massilia sp. H-1]